MHILSSTEYVQCCGKLFSDSFEKTPTLGVDTFSELVFFKLLNNDDIKCKKILVV